jgi:hypothetical protein
MRYHVFENVAQSGQTGIMFVPNTSHGFQQSFSFLTPVAGVILVARWERRDDFIVGKSFEVFDNQFFYTIIELLSMPIQNHVVGKTMILLK